MSRVNVLTDEKTAKVAVVERPLQLVGGGLPTTGLTVSTATLPPILTPPVEIISRIIELGAQDEHVDFPILVSHVCGRLRDITLATPMLWTSISFTGGKSSYDEIQARLARSKDVAIDLCVARLELRDDAETMLNMLYPHVRRWRSLSLEVWEAAPLEAIAEALVDEAPMLETLSLAGFTTTPFNPFGGRTPSLRNLSVKSMPLLWESPLFYNLDTLNIHAPTWTSGALLDKWRKLKTLVIRSDPLQPLILHFALPHIVLPDLECLELNGVTEEDIVRLLSHVEMPNLARLLFTHIKDSPNPVHTPIFPLPSVKRLRLHATEMCQDNLLSVLRKVRNLECISFEDSSPIPAFIEELTPSGDSDGWVIPNIAHFKVVAFEKDNAHRVYDDTDIAEALSLMMWKRQPVKRMAIRMCVFEGERDDVTRHAADWNHERAYKSERSITTVDAK